MIDEDVKVIKSREELKALAEKNASPCARCVQAEGCPAPAYCREYQKWRKKRKKTYEAKKK